MHRHGQPPHGTSLTDDQFDAVVRSATQSPVSPERLDRIRERVDALIKAPPSPPLWRRLARSRAMYLGVGSVVAVVAATLMTRPRVEQRAAEPPRPPRVVEPARRDLPPPPPPSVPSPSPPAARSPSPAPAPAAPSVRQRSPRGGVPTVQVPSAPPPVAAALVLQAVEHLRHKDYAQAGRLAGRYIRENPEGVATELAYRVAIEAAAGNGEVERAQNLANWLRAQYGEASGASIDKLLDDLRKEATP